MSNYENISEYLKDRYDIDIQPGKKGECCYCHKKTMGVTPNGTLAKCFHPNCLKRITLKRVNDINDELDEVLNTVFMDFHQELMNTQSEAYKYLTEGRGIHEKVIADSMIGIVPQSYNVFNTFKEILEKAQNNYNDEMIKDPNSPKSAFLKLKLDKVKYCMEQLTKCCEYKKGWICFFRTDENMTITSIRVRKPYTKEIGYYNLSGNGKGVFGLGLFGSSLKINDEDASPLIQVEGEFNQLKLQSLWLNVNGCQGNDLGEVDYIN